MRVRVSPTRFRIPGVCVVREGDANEPILERPPLLCAEVLSPRDSISGIRKRAQDFLDMSVAEVWVFDPRTYAAYICKPESMVEVKAGTLHLAGTPVELSLGEVLKPLKKKT